MADSPFYTKFNLLCAEQIREWVISTYSSSFSEDFLALPTTPPDYLRTLLDTELKSKNLPESLGYFTFVRAVSGLDPSLCHIDGPVDNGDRRFATIVIPIVGGDSGYHYWSSGEYTLEKKFTRAGVAFFAVCWVSKPEVVDKVVLGRDTYLTNSGLPHGAVCERNGPRVTFTLRLKTNPTFECLQSLLKGS